MYHVWYGVIYYQTLFITSRAVSTMYLRFINFVFMSECIYVVSTTFTCIYVVSNVHLRGIYVVSTKVAFTLYTCFIHAVSTLYQRYITVIFIN